jgi:hypothetical protein
MRATAAGSPVRAVDGAAAGGRVQEVFFLWLFWILHTILTEDIETPIGVSLLVSSIVSLIHMAHKDGYLTRSREGNLIYVDTEE